jgi:hypothetical protein
MLVGHETDPTKYFEGSGASWDGESTAMVLNVAFNGEKECQGHNLVKLQVSYGNMSLNMAKDATEALQFLD